MRDCASVVLGKVLSIDGQVLNINTRVRYPSDAFSDRDLRALEPQMMIMRVAC